jgi:hypothetical protein
MDTSIPKNRKKRKLKSENSEYFTNINKKNEIEINEDSLIYYRRKLQQVVSNNKQIQNILGKILPNFVMEKLRPNTESITPTGAVRATDNSAVSTTPTSALRATDTTVSTTPARTASVNTPSSTTPARTASVSTSSSTAPARTASVSTSSDVLDKSKTKLEKKTETIQGNNNFVHSSDHDLMKICGTKGLAMARGTPVNMTYHKPSIFHNDDKINKRNKIAIKYVYYTECDQVVKYDSMNTLKVCIRT